MRLDYYLFENALAKSRTFAKTLISDGYVEVNGKTETKASYDVKADDAVVVTGQPYEYVSRGGLKLECAKKAFSLDFTDKICVDIGASTGGFTHCLLLGGAKKVFAVDIGSNQLDRSLLCDSRVVNMENINARYLTSFDLGEKCDIAVSDISFISQTYVIPQISDLLSDEGCYVALIKPQFECGKNGLNKNGIVKDKKIRYNSVKKVVDSARENGLFVLGLIVSSIEGGDGNVEYLMYATKINKGISVDDKIIKEVCGL